MKKIITYLLLILIVLTLDLGNLQAQATPMNGFISDTALFAALNLDYPGMDSVKYYVNIGNYKAAKGAYLVYKRKNPIKWSASPPLTSDAGTDTLANQISQNILNGVNYGSDAFNINWNYLNSIGQTQADQVLVRFDFWTALVRAYETTKNETYAKAFVNQMCGWVAHIGVSLDTSQGGDEIILQRSLEMGNRMDSFWTYPFSYFINSPSFVDTAMGYFAKGILGHAWRMDTCSAAFNLGKTLPSNHQILMACGLAVTAFQWPEFRDAAKWKQDAFALIKWSMDTTVYPDGAETELAPGYHNWTRDYFKSVVDCAHRYNQDSLLPTGFLDKLKKMYWYGVYLQQPTGLFPPTNDNSDNSPASVNAAVSYWGDPEFLFASSGGTQGKMPETLSYRFPYAGFNVMRSGWDGKANYMFFKNGPIGFYGHGHEDGLSLYLTCFGQPLLVEDGGYQYDGSENMYYSRVTSAHNTITIDGKGQHREDDANFPNKLVTKPSYLPWLTNTVADYTVGVYSDGYQQESYDQNYGGTEVSRKWTGTKDYSVSHKRHLIFLKPYYYVVTDFVEGSGTHRYDNFFQLNTPSAFIDKTTKSVKTLNSTSSTNPSPQLLVYPLETNGLSVKTVTGQTSPTYQGWATITDATLKPIPSVIYTKTQAAPATFSTFLYPYNTVNTPTINTALIANAGAGIWACSGITPFENFAIAIRRYDSLNGIINLTAPLSFTANAEVGIIRQQTGSSQIKATYDSLTAYTDETTSFTCPKGNYIVQVDAANNRFLYNDNDTSTFVSISSPVSQNFTMLSHQWIQINATGVTVVSNPTIAIVAPTNKTVMVQGDTTLITTNIVTNGIPVATVSFLDSLQNIGSDSLSPYQLVYTASTVGVHNLYAKLTNNLGTTVTSQSAKVSINHFEAEDFTNNNTGTVLMDSSRSGLAKVTGISAGGWLEYSLNLNKTGKYSLDINLLNSLVGNTFSISIDGVAITNDGKQVGAVNIPYSDSHQTVTIQSFDIPSGIHTLRITFNGGIDDVDFNKITFINYYAVPGLVQAENYLKAGTNSIVPTHALINQAAIPESGGGGVAIGNLDSNWVEYAIDVANAGTYSLQVNLADRYSNNYTGGSKHIDILLGNTLLKTVTIPSYTYYNTTQIAFTTVNTTITFANAGKQIIKLNLYGGSTNFDWMNFAPTGVSVVITSPATNTIYNSLSNVNITATALANGEVKKLEFYNGDQLLGTDSSSPYSFDWVGIPAGVFRITAKAYDTAGNGFYTTPITISGKNVPPRISLVSPQQYTTFLNESNFNIVANAYDTDGTVANVQFYNGSNSLVTVTDTPYTYQWYGSTTGTYQVTATATDNLGASTTTNPLTFSVGIFEAENSIAQQGTDTISVATASNGKEVYKIDSANNYLEYLLNTDNDGQFLLGFNLSNSKLGRQLNIMIDSVPISLNGVALPDITLPITRNANRVWTQLFDIASGQHIVRVSFIGGVDSFDCMTIIQASYLEVPGVIKSENWTVSGSDTIPPAGLNVGSYTDLNGVTGTSVSGLDRNWIEYAVNVDTPGIYKVDLRLANRYSSNWTGPTVLSYGASAVTYKRVDVLVDGTYQQSVKFPSDTYDSTKTKIGFKTVSIDSFNFPTAGEHLLKLYFYGNTINYDSMNLSLLVSTLPVKLNSYTAKSIDGKTVKVEWTTGNGINSDYFIIQRSYDGKNFESIGNIMSVSNGHLSANYIFIDDNPLQGDNYYRLVEVANDGKSTYFDVKLVTIQGGNQLQQSFTLFPNPLHQSQLSVQLPSLINGNVDIQLINNYGQVVFYKTMKINGTELTLSLPPNLANGIYTIKINQFLLKKLFICK